MLTEESMMFIQEDMNKSRDELLELIVVLRKQILEYKSYMDANSEALTAMSKDYNKLLEEVKSLRESNKELSDALTLVAEKELLKTNEIFGKGSEKFSDAFNSISDIEVIDESETEVIPFPGNYSNSEPNPSFNSNTTETNGNKDPKKTKKAKKNTDLSKLPSMERFILEIDKLNALYGEGNWRIAHWHKHTSVEHNRAAAYVVNYYSPVVSVGLEHQLITIPHNCLLPRSFVSASLMAEILYQKFFMYVPLYRQEKSFSNFGLDLSRQTMSNWVNRFAFEYFSLIEDRLHELMMEVSFHQCDETTLQVINDGRPSGSKSYVWVHITSELLDTHPIIQFCYELTRGTDHLRKFYEDFKGYITCDAYCSYHTLEKEKQDIIIICGCMMHLRRRFFQSLLLVSKDNLTGEQIESLPETIALSYIGKIYAADEKLKVLNADERKIQRDLQVKPLIDKFYSYIDTLNINDPLMSNRLKDAVCYANNQKQYLCRFLEDGNIPIDDGATERKIRALAIGRSNFMFCNTIDGARALATMYTIVETARANQVNVYSYLRYILEEMPQYMDGKDLGFVDRFLPWSEEYLEYEKAHNFRIPFVDEHEGFESPPRTPRKTSNHSPGVSDSAPSLSA